MVAGSPETPSAARLYFGYAALVAGSAAMLAAGYALPSATSKQIGALGLLLSVLGLPLIFLSASVREAILRKSKHGLVGLLVATALFFAVGEIALRIVYAGGESFSTAAGPLVRRFQRDFRFNRYDGPSRGPEVSGPRSSDSVRVLVQGDSITWGQGVRDERLLFTSVLLDALRRTNPRAEMAVLARPGREIDGHLEQLRKWGQEVSPDVIIYLWYVNDMELDKSRRPRATRPWRRFFFHRPLAEQSYFWFLLDFVLDQRLPSNRQPYSEYIVENFGEGTDGMRKFVEVFDAWAAEAKRLTPRVVVALYPDGGPPSWNAEVMRIHDRLAELCHSRSIEALPLDVALGAFGDEPGRLRATRFDEHPSAAAHAAIGEALLAKLEERWPELVR